LSSERILACCVAIHVVALGGCADVRRGEYWHEPAGSSGAAGSDAMDDGDGAAASTSGGAGESDDGGSTGGDSTGGATGLSFAADVEPLLDAGCERCHSSDGQASTTAFLLVGEIEADYETTIEFVNLGDPEASRLLAKGAGKGHTGGVVFDDRSSEYETILQWIEQGAEP
jgi:hypothetical protein